MRVGFAKARTGYANEARAGAKIVDRRRADVAHARAESTDELMHDRRERTERANTTLDALGDELGELADVGLSVAVARTPRLHRAKRAHPALDPVGPGRDQLLGTLGRGHISSDDADTMPRLHLFDHPHDGRGVAMRGVDHDHVDTRPYERRRALIRVAGDADRCADDQVSVLRPPHLSDLRRHGPDAMDDTATAGAPQPEGSRA